MSGIFVMIGILVTGTLVLSSIANANLAQTRMYETIAESNAIQNNKMRENISGIIEDDGTLRLTNQWEKTTRVREIRVVDDSGRVLYRTPVDFPVPSFQTVTYSLCNADSSLCP